MIIKTEFYGRLKDDFSQDPIEFEVTGHDSNITLEQVYLMLCEKYHKTPNSNLIKPILNDTFAEWDEVVKASDVIGFFPPASGG